MAPLARVLLKHPRDAFVDAARIARQWRPLGYSAPPDLAAAMGEYEELLELLGDSGPCFLPRDEATTLDSIYAHDPFLVADGGAILGNMGKEARRAELAAVEDFLAADGIPILGRIEGEGRLEAGDLCWLDERTLAVGQGYRTNAEGLRQLGLLLGEEVELVPVPLPHWHGPGEVLHLRSLISPVDTDLAVVHSRRLPVPFRQLLLARGIALVEVPDAEIPSQGANVLALAPRRCVMVRGNPVTQGGLEAAGAEVLTFAGNEICLKGMGGPTCLTRALSRVCDDTCRILP